MTEQEQDSGSILDLGAISEDAGDLGDERDAAQAGPDVMLSQDTGVLEPKDGGMDAGVVDLGIEDPDLGLNEDLGMPPNADAGVPDQGAPDTGFVSAFNYAPTNFDPALYPSGASVTLNCEARIRAEGTVNFQEWCGQPIPPVYYQPQPGGPEVAIIVVRDFGVLVGASLRIEGPRPVILAVHGQAMIQGVIDTSFNVSTQQANNCPTSGEDGGANIIGSGGGGGGAGNSTFGGEGGRSGDNAPGGMRGPAIMGGLVVPLEPLMGGCPGGEGGNGAVVNGSGGRGGAGGGGLQISVATDLVITGAVLSAGEGGRGGERRAGGGGGGSGGGLLLECDTLVLGSMSSITANGGGGGQGNADRASNGDNGDDGQPDSTAVAQGGQSGGDRGGDGGDGGALSDSPTDGQRSEEDGEGGGGGGGAAGRIQIYADSLNCTLVSGATLSPTPNSNCILPL